jgi:site-specific DNA recombinase
VIELANAKGAGGKRKQSRSVIRVSWRKILPTRRRELLLPECTQPENARPIRSENRALLVASIARGRRWLDELIADPAATTESIAKRERCSARKVNMTISLAFLAPDLVKAAIDGRLPHGMGVARLADLSAEWSRQRQMLGLPVLYPFHSNRGGSPEGLM